MLSRIFVIALSSIVAAAHAEDSFSSNDDFLLPLPGGAEMSFRPVFLGIGENAEGNLKFKIGDRTGTNYKESLADVSVGGAFVSERDHKRDVFYYLGKTEVSRRQWNAVNALEKGAIVNEALEKEDGTLPIVNISRLDIDQFLTRYNRWLRTSSKDRLPKHDGAPGLLRLPTEAEWEFAARGGRSVSPEQFNAAIPYTDNIGKHEWFAGPRSSHGKLRPVGLLDPNPLGLQDMLGNAAELTETRYQLQRGSGPVGGLTIRGGHALDDEINLRSSLRRELPDLTPDGEPGRSPTVGFRLVIAAQIITGENDSKLESRLLALPAGIISTPSKPITEPISPEIAKIVAQVTARRLELEAEHDRLTPSKAKTPLAAGTRVRLIRDEPLYFESQLHRQGNIGEIFRIARHNPAQKRLYLVSTGKDSKVLALNCDHAAAEVLLDDAETLFGISLDTLRSGHEADALRLLGQLTTTGGATAVQVDLYAQLRNFIAANAALQRARAATAARIAEASRIERNASVTDRPDILFRTNQFQQRAGDMRKQAAEMRAKADDSARQCNRDFDVAIRAIESFARTQYDAGFYDVVISLDRFLAVHGRTLETVLPSGNETLVESARKFQDAEAAYQLADAAWAKRHLHKCDTHLLKTFEFMPVHRRGLRLRERTVADLQLVTNAVQSLSVLRTQPSPLTIRQLSTDAFAICKDDEQLNQFLTATAPR